MHERGVVVRGGTSADILQLMALERGSAGAPHWSEAMYRATVDRGEMLDGGTGRILLVAADGGELAGFGVASDRGGTAELESVVVRAEWRRRGIGRRLCGDLMRWAAGRGTTTMELEVRCSSGAIALYEQVGFQRQGMRKGYYFDPEEDALLMSVSLARLR